MTGQACLSLFVINIRHVHRERRRHIFFLFREQLEHGILLRCKSREQKYARKTKLYNFRREQYLSSYHARRRILGVSKREGRGRCLAWDLLFKVQFSWKAQCAECRNKTAYVYVKYSPRCKLKGIEGYAWYKETHKEMRHWFSQIRSSESLPVRINAFM